MRRLFKCAEVEQRRAKKAITSHEPSKSVTLISSVFFAPEVSEFL